MTLDKSALSNAFAESMVKLIIHHIDRLVLFWKFALMDFGNVLLKNIYYGPDMHYN